MRGLPVDRLGENTGGCRGESEAPSRNYSDVIPRPHATCSQVTHTSNAAKDLPKHFQRSSFYVVLPKPEDPPSLLTQLCGYGPVAGLVSRDLATPVLCVRFREPQTIRATVPEAPIHENGDARISKDEVWTAEHFRRVENPTRHTGPDEIRAKPAFSGTVAARTDLRHYRGPRCSVYVVHVNLRSDENS